VCHYLRSLINSTFSTWGQKKKTLNKYKVLWSYKSKEIWLRRKGYPATHLRLTESESLGLSKVTSETKYSEWNNILSSKSSTWKMWKSNSGLELPFLLPMLQYYNLKLEHSHWNLIFLQYYFAKQCYCSWQPRSGVGVGGRSAIWFKFLQSPSSSFEQIPHLSPT
jgi:hypothetical protein